ncbi:hypothetical protein LVB87_06325 [Lysobacter sp. KIS68-7]|uniref:hypothetical protein n=1 Tax=Lysobacter sp. KIS68-7 TaxID=2904252 RepID=UPI001E4C1057|nr:hypothetical protein [Lysobacter sp. KIS68-7]UHQ20755.1 hypothetical protein LVB87_06325 [Lysobacter sp. KIS68-7]
MPLDPPSNAEPSPHASMRDGMHDLRNVLNAVQINAFAARQLVDDATRTLACIGRIEAAAQRGTHLLQTMPAEETLATAAAMLRERLRDAGGEADVRVDGAPDAGVPGLLRQALCLVAVESQAHGAHAFVLVRDDMEPGLHCKAEGLHAPGPIALALADTDVADLRLRADETANGWDFHWPLPGA